MIVKDKNGCFFCGEKITEKKYESILVMLKNPPIAPEGFGYRLTSTLEWEIYEAPAVNEDPELSYEEVLNILLGGDDR